MLAIALSALPAMGNGNIGAAASAATMGTGDNQGTGPFHGVDVLGGGIFESDSGASRFNTDHSTNFDSISVGNDYAFATKAPFPFSGPVATAQNNLEIKKNQMSGESTCCDSVGVCQECNPQVNLEQISLGNRQVFAFGNALAQNNIKIVTNQE